MAKLIYVNKTKADAIKVQSQGGIFGSAADSWQSSSSEYYKSIVFTNDGHILTHGIDFSITASSGLIGGAAGSIPYQSATDTTTFLAIGTQNKVLTSSGSIPQWSDVGVKLNGANSWALTSSFYAPTAAGTQYQILMSNGSGAPIWKTLTTKSEGTDGHDIPTLDKVNELIGNSITSLFSWQGSATVTGTTLTIPTNPKVGYAYRIPSATTLPQDNSTSGSAETLEAGDIIICTDATTPKFTAVQTNWATTAGNSELVWNTEKTLGTVGGLAIKAKLPADPLTRISYTSYLSTADAGHYTLGVFTKDGTNTTVYGIDTQYSFYVGGTGAKADAAVTNGTDVYLTTKTNTTDPSTNGVNILGLHAGTGISISASNSKLITVTNTGVTAATATAASNVTGVYTVGTLTYNGNTVTFYGHDVNTWRDIEGFKITAIPNSSNYSQASSATSISSNKLRFSKTFSVYEGTDGTSEIDLIWEEIDSSGNKTYAV